MTKKHQKLAVLGVGALLGGAVFYKRNFRMPLKEYTRYALYMATLDDEICRSELEENLVGERKIVFPPKAESLQYRYHLFLEMNLKKSREDILHDISQMERRLAEASKFWEQESVPLEVVMTSDEEKTDEPEQSAEVTR